MAVQTPGTGLRRRVGDPVYMSRKFESLEKIGYEKHTEILTHIIGWEPVVYMSHMFQNFRLVPSHLYESKFPYVSRIACIHSKPSIFSAHVSGVSVSPPRRVGGGGGAVQTNVAWSRPPPSSVTACSHVCRYRCHHN